MPFQLPHQCDATDTTPNTHTFVALQSRPCAHRPRFQSDCTTWQQSHSSLTTYELHDGVFQRPWGPKLPNLGFQHHTVAHTNNETSTSTWAAGHYFTTRILGLVSQQSTQLCSAFRLLVDAPDPSQAKFHQRSCNASGPQPALAPPLHSSHDERRTNGHRIAIMLPTRLHILP